MIKTLTVYVPHSAYYTNYSRRSCSWLEIMARTRRLEFVVCWQSAALATGGDRRRDDGKKCWVSKEQLELKMYFYSLNMCQHSCKMCRMISSDNNVRVFSKRRVCRCFRVVAVTIFSRFGWLSGSLQLVVFRLVNAPFL